MSLLIPPPFLLLTLTSKVAIASSSRVLTDISHHVLQRGSPLRSRRHIAAVERSVRSVEGYDDEWEYADGGPSKSQENRAPPNPLAWMDSAVNPPVIHIIELSDDPMEVVEVSD